MERTRLARNLHDTLEQTLTGIALEFDTALKLAARAPDDARRHLDRARHWLRQSQIQLRHSIWDLRSRELEQFELGTALEQMAARLCDSSSLEIHFVREGERYALPEVVEENLLRIAQEAMTNVVKHARATRMEVKLVYAADAVRLFVSDDGVGFQHCGDGSPSIEGHYGLVGMSERAHRIKSCVDVQSTPGEGTTVSVEVVRPRLETTAPALLKDSLS